MQHPLKFSGQSRLLYNDGTFGRFFNRTIVTSGVKPEGSEWAMNPIPRIDFDAQDSGQPKGWTGCQSISSPGSTRTPISLACRQFESPACDEVGPPPPRVPALRPRCKPREFLLPIARRSSCGCCSRAASHFVSCFRYTAKQ